jgi:Sulfotransferase family
VVRITATVTTTARRSNDPALLRACDLRSSMSPPAAHTERAIRPAEVAAGQRPFLKDYRTWPRFRRGPRSSGGPLLASLGRYPDCVLVAGCQRSGTTMLTRIIAGASGFWRLALTRDDELDAALVLSGYVDIPTDRRYCFQTTYLNECFFEYRTIGARQKLIWVLRNPHSVVHSMVYNWKRFALNELYVYCGAEPADIEERRRVARFPWPFGISRVERACSAYAGKSMQIFAIREMVPPEQLLIVDYDQMVRAPTETLETVFRFIGEPYCPTYASSVRGNSARKSDVQSDSDHRTIDHEALPVYNDCLKLVRG